MNLLLKIPANLLILLMFTLAASQSFAADDYMWEEKFTKEMAKAKQGNAKSQYAVGEMYEKGKGTEADTTNAFKWYVKSAGKGDKKGAYKVGLFYYKGIAVSKDFKKARSWFIKSADKRYARAEYFLGEIYENGRGVSRNSKTALKWYKRSLAGGYGAAEAGVKRVVPGKKSVAKKKREKSKSKKKSTPKVKARTAEQVLKTVLKGGWKKRKRPIEYLPSSVAKCKRTGKNLECKSSTTLKRNIGMADINYTTKANISGFTADGEFEVSYRNNVKNIKVTSEEFAESGEPVPVKLGWQDKEHTLECILENTKKITCTKNNTRKVVIKR